MNRLLLLLFTVLTIGLSAQEPMRVTRSAAVDRNAPIYNIYVDADNNKWVGNSKGVFQVHTVDYASQVELEPGQGALLRYPGGNFNFIWNTASLFNIMKSATDNLFEGEQDISGAFYDAMKKELWIGTKGIGVFRFDMKGDGELLEHMTMDNSKLRTDMITVMFSDRPGSYWIGTEEGVLHNTGSKWKLYERFVSVEAIDASATGVWVFGEDWLWKVDNRDNWEEIDLDESMSEGKIRDIAFDSKGRMWIASEVISRFNPELGSVETFGAAEYFTSDFPSALAVDQEDAIWVGTEDKGLYLIEKATAMTISCILDKAPGCDGQNDAEIKVVVSGGDEPYTYKWNADLQGENPKGVPPGEYEVTVTDSRSKSKISQITINNPALTLELVQVQPESGAGASDGIASVSVSGGQGEYTYRWDNGETGQKAMKLDEGQHGVTVTDKTGCRSNANVSITQEAAPLSASIEQTNQIDCNGASTAALAVNVKGGKGPFQYAWNLPALSGDSPNNLTAGDYELTITDSEGKASTDKFSIKEPVALAANINVETPASTGNADGKATVAVTGGNSPYTYSWDTGESTATASKLAPGTRTVTITDASGCTTTANIEISENILPLNVSIDQTAEINCKGESTAAVAVKVNGGKGPFQYAWNVTSLSGDSPKDIAAGDYEVTITDGEGTSSTAKIAIKEPEALAASINVEAPASTGNVDGKATVKTSGGAGSYTYSWDTGESTATASKLAPGTRTVTITDASGCTTTANIEISENILPLNASIDQTAEINCKGESTAAVAVKVNGGKGPFQYAWNVTSLSGDSPKDIAAGDYEVTITDGEGTSSTAKIAIKEPEALAASINVEAPASTGNADGKATVKTSGGAGSYTYSWDTGESTATASKLAPGTRTVTITDASGCTTTANIEISENILPLNASIDQTAEINCKGESTAAVAVKVNGGKGPFQYAWNVTSLSGDSPKDIAAGDYEVTITDGEGTSSTAKIAIKEPEALAASINVEAPASTGNVDGKATVKTSGGAGSYTYSWDTGESTATASKLAPGTRTVTITDASGCTTTANIEISENILPLNASIDQTAEINCKGESTAAVAVKVNGGKGPFQYAWNVASLSGESPKDIAAGDYEVTITDGEGTSSTAKIAIKEPEALAASINVETPASTGNADGKATVKTSGGAGSYTYSWDSGESTATASKLAPGTRTVRVTDASGCTTTANIEINENILPLNASIDQTAEINCKGESTAAVAVKVNGGKGPFQYAWNVASLSGESPKDIAAGDYEVTITDGEGTSSTAKIAIKEPEALAASINVETPASTGNADGKATVKTSGGAGSYTYSWDTGESTATASKLAPGTRTVRVTDASGCTTTANIEINENILPLNASIDQTAEINCKGESTAAVAVKVNGGKGPFQYAWNVASLSGDSPKNIAAGDYEVTITDGVGTSSSAKVKITEPETLSAEMITNKPTSNENSEDGTAKVKVNGGTGPFSFSWDNGEKGAEARELGVGNHSLTVTDNKGCSITLNVETKKRILPQLTAANMRAGQTVKMEQLFFEADSFQITSVSLPVLDELYGFLVENTSVVIEVGGHTNNIPETAFCDMLSSSRAKAVANYMIQKGIDPNRVYYKGYGKRKPLFTNRTAEGRAKNQRVEIKILSI